MSHQDEIQQQEDNFNKHFKYKGQEYKDMEDALAAFILDDQRKPYDQVMYHTRDNNSGIQLAGVSDYDGSLFFTQMSEHKQRPEIKEGAELFNKLNSMSKEELSIYIAEKNFPKHYTYKGNKFENQEDAFVEFVLDDNKKPGDGITYNTRSNDYGLEIVGVNNDGEIWYTQMSDHLERPEIKSGAQLFEKVKDNEIELRIQREESVFDKHYSYKGQRYDEPESAMKAFFEDSEKLPNSSGVTFHPRSNSYGVQLTGTDENNKPWFTKMREDLIRPEVKDCLKKFKEIAEKFTTKRVKDVQDSIASLKEMRGGQLDTKKDKLNM